MGNISKGKLWVKYFFTEHELEQLVKLGIYHPVASFKWAAPIVSVFKGDGSIHICEAYKQTANKEANCDQYPNQIYFCYIEWEEGGRWWWWVHKTRFEPSLSATSFTKFKRTLHHKHSQRTLSTHQVTIWGTLSTWDISERLCLKLQKCLFMQYEVVYLGSKNNKNGVFPVKEKTVIIKNAEEPKNASELKSYLGLMNYYHRHFQGFTDTLEPLHNLLRKGVKWEWQEIEKMHLRKGKKSWMKQTF